MKAELAIRSAPARPDVGSSQGFPPVWTGSGCCPAPPPDPDQSDTHEEFSHMLNRSVSADMVEEVCQRIENVNILGAIRVEP